MKGKLSLGRTGDNSEDFFRDDLSDVICFTIGEKKIVYIYMIFKTLLLNLDCILLFLYFSTFFFFIRYILIVKTGIFDMSKQSPLNHIPFILKYCFKKEIFMLTAYYCYLDVKTCLKSTGLVLNMEVAGPACVRWVGA